MGGWSELPLRHCLGRPPSSGTAAKVVQPQPPRSVQESIQPASRDDLNAVVPVVRFIARIWSVPS